MINVGIDFGSTNTTVSVYSAKSDCPQAVVFNLGSPYVPSVVCHDKKLGKYHIGANAKNKVGAGKPGDRVFYKAFKMLIPEKNEQILKQRGYDGENSPQKIAGIFIESLLKKTLEEIKDPDMKINKLVIAVPEIWRDEQKTVDGIPMLREICEGIPFVENVAITSEPEAASAYFAHNYKKETCKNYEGCILLIDYGGGTLDITLTQVASLDNGKSVQIKSLERTGAGENEEGDVGKAGIVYMETVVLEAMKRAGIIKEDSEIFENPEEHGKFYKAVYTLEGEILSQADDIKEMLREYEAIGIADSVEELEEEEFAYIPYRGQSLVITYGLLVDVYNRKIRKVLNDKLEEIEAFMKAPEVKAEYNIDYMNTEQEVFKIAIVGGFGKYYLVEEQVRSFFKANTMNDKRFSNIIRTGADCEQAISLGTALLADDIIGIKDVAPYSIGVWAYNQNGDVVPNYAFKIKQEIEHDKLYFVKNPDGKDAMFQSIGGDFRRFIINFKRDDRYKINGVLEQKYRNKLKNIVSNATRKVHVAFSLSKNEILTIHVFPYDPFRQVRGEGKSVELARLGDMFDVLVD